MNAVTNISLSQRTNWFLFNYTLVNSSLPLTWRQTAIHLYSSVLINNLHAELCSENIYTYIVHIEIAQVVGIFNREN